jgi:hypothetical protein
MELTKRFENFKTACYSDMGDDQYYETLKSCLLEISKVSIQTISWIDETKDYDEGMEGQNSLI